MKTLLFTIILLIAAMLMLGVKVLTVKGGQFPSHHGHHHGKVTRQSQSKTE